MNRPLNAVSKYWEACPQTDKQLHSWAVLLTKLPVREEECASEY